MLGSRCNSLGIEPISFNGIRAAFHPGRSRPTTPLTFTWSITACLSMAAFWSNTA